MADARGVFDVDAQCLVDVETVHPCLGEAESGKGAGAHVPGYPGETVVPIHVGEGLDHLGPTASPPFDDVLGAHAAALLDGPLTEGLDVRGGLPLLDHAATLERIRTQILEVGEVSDGVPDGPGLVRSDQIPHLDWDPLQGLVQELLLSN
jgi:hypothetical protein